VLVFSTAARRISVTTATMDVLDIVRRRAEDRDLDFLGCTA